MAALCEERPSHHVSVTAQCGKLLRMVESYQSYVACVDVHDSVAIGLEGS